MELKAVLKKRKSIRKYDENKQISEKQLKYILSAGMAAPVSRKDYSSIKIIVVQDKNLLSKLSDPLLLGQNLLYNVPTLIILASKECEVHSVECFNVACIVQNMLLAATDLNLGSIYLTSFLDEVYKKENLIKELKIPKEYKAISAVGVGFMIEDEAEYEACEIASRIDVVRK